MAYAALVAGDSDVPVLVDIKCLKLSQTLTSSIKSCEIKNDCYRIPLPSIKHELLKKVVVFMNHYTFERKFTTRDIVRSQLQCLEMLEWDRDFLFACGRDTLIQLNDAARRLKLEHLEDICTRKVMRSLKGKDLETMRRILRVRDEENCPCFVEPCCSTDDCDFYYGPRQ